MAKRQHTCSALPHPLVLALAAAYLSMAPAYAANANTPQAVKKDEAQLSTIEVDGSRINKDEVGYSRVYTRDVVNLYKGKQEIETYKGNTVSDLLNGMVGVYSGDARNSGALDPNIRGMQGEGRIPVTVDGTEQSITVWRGYAGVNNRNYVDPNLISSIYVEKGPSLNPEIRSGIGGSVAMKTIDADDIVPQGQKYGLEVKIESGNNAVAPRKNVYAQSQDYRNLNNPNAALGGMWRLYFDDSDRMEPRSTGRNRFFKDNAFRIAAGTKQENFDAVLAYAYRDKGNYFSGTKGAERYGYREIKSLADVKDIKLDPSDPYIALIGLVQHPGNEVTNTSLNTRSWLGKFTLRLPERQKLKFGLRHTNSRFGEILPSQVIGPIVDHDGKLNKVVEWPQAWVKQKAFNIDYQWQPEDNRWIDFNASLWTTRTHSKTNSAGGSPGDALYEDMTFRSKYQTWKALMDNWDKFSKAQQDYFTAQGMTKKPTGADSDVPNTDGRFNTVSGEAYYAKNNRVGFNFANRMKLTDKLELTLMGDFQYETLQSTNHFENAFANPGGPISAGEKAGDKVRFNTSLYNIALPRNGKRHEGNYGFNFKYRPVHWLTLTAGARYTRFSVQDDYVKGYLETKRDAPITVNKGMRYRVLEAVDSDQVARREEAIRKSLDERIPASERITAEERDLIYNARKAKDVYGNTGVYLYSRLNTLAVVDAGTVFTWEKDQYGRLRMADNPFTNGKINLKEMVDQSGAKISKYIVRGASDNIVAPLSEAQKAAAHKQRGRGWAPMASATIQFTDNARAYVRYSESLRYPSLFEGTIGFSTVGRSVTSSRLGYVWKPEHAKNWEVGYVHDLSALIPRARYADFRINYFNNTTKNIIDRDAYYNFYQYDKQKLSGVELQTRLDFGRVFADLGVVRSLKNQVCDEAAAFVQSGPEGWENGRRKAPVCQNGGMNETSYLATMVPPRWSVTANLGARFFSNRLEAGTRFVYHSRVYDTRSRSLAGSGVPAGETSVRWQPVAVYDAYLRYRFNKNLTAELVGSNLTNRYYLDPMARSYMPAPGRTIRVGVSGKF